MPPLSFYRDADLERKSATSPTARRRSYPLRSENVTFLLFDFDLNEVLKASREDWQILIQAHEAFAACRPLIPYKAVPYSKYNFGMQLGYSNW